MEGYQSLSCASPEEQREVMEEWFRSHYEDPVESTPFDSREGGYIWVWGGPYDAGEELREKFEGLVPDEVIDELASALTDECPGWTSTDRGDAYDETLYEAVSSNALARQTLEDALSTVLELLKVAMPDELGGAYLRLLFANAISALETYLSDTFINRVFADQELLQTYVDSEPKFKERKVAFKDVLREAARLEDEARKELLDVVWHNIAKVKPMYAQVLEVDLGNLDTLGAAIRKRHDIVHRNGRSREGQLIEVSSSDVEQLLLEIDALALRVEAKLDSWDDPFAND
jgi:hypothetical protein